MATCCFESLDLMIDMRRLRELLLYVVRRKDLRTTSVATSRTVVYKVKQKEGTRLFVVWRSCAPKKTITTRRAWDIDFKSNNKMRGQIQKQDVHRRFFTRNHFLNSPQYSNWKNHQHCRSPVSNEEWQQQQPTHRPDFRRVACAPPVVGSFRLPSLRPYSFV